MSIGVRGSLALPLDIGTEAVGALSFHYVKARVPHTRTLPILQAVAGHSSAALRIALQHEQLRATMAQLEATMATERLVNHAVGIIMGKTRCSPQQASAILYETAKKLRQKVTDVAADMVHQATGEPPDENLHFFRERFATSNNRTDIGQRA